MSRQQLPCASQTQRALLGIILQFPNRLSDCDRFGINDTHFQGVELELWQEIVWAEADGRPFDINLAIKCSDIFQSSTNVMGWNNEMPAPFPRFSLGPGQRYGSKGAYIVRFGGPGETRIVRDSDWIVP